MSRVITLLKKLPVDVGQAEKKHDTAGKRIAFSFVPIVPAPAGAAPAKEKTALDIGCRDGYWSERLKEKGYRVSALDIKPSYAGAMTHDAEDGLPYADHSFDLVWCTEVVEHLQKPESLFSEIDRVLRSGGIAILTTPNSSWWFYSVVRLWGWTPQKLQNPDHKQFFDEKKIRMLARGWRVLGYFPYAFFFFPIRRLIGLLSPTFVMVKRF